jgi:hypothetical protein
MDRPTVVILINKKSESSMSVAAPSIKFWSEPLEQRNLGNN